MILLPAEGRQRLINGVEMIRQTYRTEELRAAAMTELIAEVRREWPDAFREKDYKIPLENSE